jgi:type I restriction enzyme S subunit
MSDSPAGWFPKTIADLTGLDGLMTDGDWIESQDQDPNGEVRLIQLADIGDGVFLNKSSRFLTERKARELQCTFLKKGDLLIARMPDPLGRACIFPGVGQKAVTAVDVCIWRAGEDGAEARWLKHVINSPQIREEIALRAGGTTRQRISGGNLKRLAVPTPPIAEQLRIAAKVDNLLARSRAARAELARIPRLVERYKQAVLAAAFSGELTAEWRSSHNLPSPTFVSLNELCLSIADGDHQAPPRVENGIPFITISAMNDRQIDLSKATRFVPKSYAQKLKASRRPKRGDVLFSVTGSIGIPALVKTDDEFVFQRHIAILRPDSTKTSGRYVNYLLAAPQVMEQALSVATGTAQLTIPLSGLREFRVPLPTLEEQSVVIRHLDSQFASLEKAARECTRASVLIDRLERATLTKAFSGKLTIHDGDDVETSPISIDQTPSLNRGGSEEKMNGRANRRSSMPRITLQSARETIRSMAADRFSFDDLRTHLSADYEILREIVFGLLDEPNPVISQVFDSQTKSIVFSRSQK